MAVAAAIAMGAAIGGVHVPDAAATPRTAAAAHTTTLRTTLIAAMQAAITKSPATEATFFALERRTATTAAASGNECLYFATGQCLTFDPTGGDLVSVGALIIATLSLILQGITSRGKDKGDPQEKPDVTSGGSLIGCISAYGTTVVIQSCNPVASTWIEVPTGGSYALENLYWYDQNTGVNNYMLTAPSTSGEGQVYLHGAISGHEDLRTWFNTDETMQPVGSAAA